MIKRKIPKSITPAESLKEHSFTAVHGIDVTTAPTIRDNVYDATNLEVCSDGALSLRKPLIFSKDLRKNATNIIGNAGELVLAEYIFNNKNMLYIVKKYDKIYIYYERSDGFLTNFRITDANEKDIDHSLKDCFTGDDIAIVNTTDSTIITGIQIDFYIFLNNDIVYS